MKSEYIFKVIKSFLIILNILIIVAFSFFIMGFSPIFNISIILGVVLLYKYQNKLISRIGKIKLLLIYTLPVILILFFILYLFISIRIEIVKEWNKIKEDYEVINNVALEFYEGNNEKYITLYFEENYTSLIDYDYTKKDENGDYQKTIISLNEKEKKALKNIANFYPNQECVSIGENDIDYVDSNAVGAYIVRYVRNKRKVVLKGFHHLTGNWYYFRAR